MNLNLVKKYLEGNASQHEKEEVFRWIKASPRNEREFAHARRVQDFFIWHPSDKEHRIPHKKILSSVFLRVAAVFLGVILLSVFVYRSTFFTNHENTTVEDKAISMQQVTVPAGQSVKLLLTDGTTVWLNSKSKLVFPDNFGDSQREVQLYGEGFFEVAHDPAHPFIVNVGSCSVKVLGTEFNVKAYDAGKNVETSLLSGSIEINLQGNSESLLLEPYECAVITGGEVKMTTFDRDSFLWREGVLSLDNKNIYEIARLLEQYYDTKIQIMEGRKMTRRYTGKFRLQDGASHILKVLELQNDFKVENDTIHNLITIE